MGKECGIFIAKTKEAVMNEKWMEEIKHNDEMTMLDRYFPGQSCGNPECERLCIGACTMAKKTECFSEWVG